MVDIPISTKTGTQTEDINQHPNSWLFLLFFTLIYFGHIHLNSSLSAQHLGINGPTKLVIVDC
jgi:hypothetical protein